MWQIFMQTERRVCEFERGSGQKDHVEATTSRNDHAQANRTALEKAEDYWPDYVSTHKH